MRMAFNHHHADRRHHRPIRTLGFAVIVIIIAMMISAMTFLRENPVTITQSDNESVFAVVALDVVDGKEVFDRVCTACHSVDRPSEMAAEPIAPPMKMIAQRYTMAADSPEEAHSRIVRWLEEPDADKSLMPPMAIEHHGLMPPVVLTPEERSAVAEYVLSLTQSERGMMQRMHQNEENGRGMMMGRMGEESAKKGCKPGEGESQMKCPMKPSGEQGAMKGCKHGESEGQGEGHQHGQNDKS